MRWRDGRHGNGHFSRLVSGPCSARGATAQVGLYRAKDVQRLRPNCAIITVLLALDKLEAVNTFSSVRMGAVGER